MTKSFESQTIPVISTSHITQEVNDLLVEENAPWCASANHIGFGFFIRLANPRPHEGVPVPQCLLDICDWRVKMTREGLLDDCGWVQLDRDAAPIEDLPTYEW